MIIFRGVVHAYCHSILLLGSRTIIIDLYYCFWWFSAIGFNFINLQYRKGCSRLPNFGTKLWQTAQHYMYSPCGCVSGPSDRGVRLTTQSRHKTTCGYQPVTISDQAVPCIRLMQRQRCFGLGIAPTAESLQGRCPHRRFFDCRISLLGLLFVIERCRQNTVGRNVIVVYFLRRPTV